MRGQGWQACDDALGLNIWWNLNRLRGPSRKDRLLGFSVFFHNFF